MRKYVSLKILKSFYFAIFDSYLSYCCLVWAQNHSTIQQIAILQKKAVRINFQSRNFYTSCLFKQNSILKFQVKICLSIFLVVRKSLNNLTLSVGLVFPQINITMKPQVLHRVTSQNFFIKTNRFGKYLITASAVESWNKIKQLKDMLLNDLSPRILPSDIEEDF